MSIQQNLLPRLTAHTVFMLQQTAETDLEVTGPPSSIIPSVSSVKSSSSLQGILICCTPNNIFITSLFAHIRMYHLAAQWQLLAVHSARTEGKPEVDSEDLYLSPANAQLHFTEAPAVFDEN